MTNVEYFGDDSADFVGTDDVGRLAGRQFTFSVIVGVLLLVSAALVSAHQSGADRSRAASHLASAPVEAVVVSGPQS